MVSIRLSEKIRRTLENGEVMLLRLKLEVLFYNHGHNEMHFFHVHVYFVDDHQNLFYWQVFLIEEFKKQKLKTTISDHVDKEFDNIASLISFII